MLGSLGPTELIIILIIVILLFGVGRIGKIAGELGGGIRSFRDGLKGDENEENPGEDDNSGESYVLSHPNNYSISVSLSVPMIYGDGRLI